MKIGSVTNLRVVAQSRLEHDRIISHFQTIYEKQDKENSYYVVFRHLTESPKSTIEGPYSLEEIHQGKGCEIKDWTAWNKYEDFENKLKELEN